MKLVLLLLLLVYIHFVLCITTSTDSEAKKESLSPPTIVPEETHEKSVFSSNIESMWAVVRQHLGNLNFNDGIPKIATAAATNTTEDATTDDKEEIDTNSDQDKLPSQMEPIEKALIYSRPKANERWILNEDGLITWAVSNYLESKAGSIYMNCNLYLDGKMILSVFKGVPLNIGIESWTPPVFLEPSPNYRLRLWSQPSPVGTIDEYSPIFSIVPRVEDAFMFTYTKSVLLDSNNKTSTNAGLVPTRKMRVGHTDLPMPTVSENHDMAVDVKNTPSSSINNPDMPTGIYALYPSSANGPYVNICGIFIVTAFLVPFLAS